MSDVPKVEADAMRFQNENKFITWPETLTDTISECEGHMPKLHSQFPIIVAWISNGKRKLNWEEVKPFYESYRNGQMWVTS